MGLAISLGIAPVFIITLLFKATSDLFGAWSKFTLNFAMILILTAGIIGVIVNIIQNYSSDAAGATGLAGMLEVIIISVAAIFFLMQVPSYAMALAGSMAAGGISIANATLGTLKAGRDMTDAANTAVGHGANVASSIGAGRAKAQQTEGGTFTKTRAAGSAFRDQYSVNKTAAKTASTGSRLRTVARDAKARRATTPLKPKA